MFTVMARASFGLSAAYAPVDLEGWLLLCARGGLRRGRRIAGVGRSGVVLSGSNSLSVSSLLVMGVDGREGGVLVGLGVSYPISSQVVRSPVSVGRELWSTPLKARP